MHPSHVLSQEKYSLWSGFLVHLCKMISPGFFFIFDIFIFQAVKGVKGQKIAQDDKKLCLLHFMSQEPYILWSWFMVHMHKMMIYPGFFYIFSKFWFLRSILGQNSKKWPEMTIMSVTFHIWESIHRIIVFFLLHKFKMMTSPDVCFIFSKFWFPGLLGVGGNRVGNGPKWQKILSHSVSQELYLIWLCFLVHMCKMMISSEFFSVFQKSDLSGFSKFINEWENEILRCAPPSSFVCDFFFQKCT